MVRTVSKPAGLPVFPPHADPEGDCVLARLLAAEPAQGEVAWPPGFEGGILHRLDTGTSGAVAYATTLEELGFVRDLFAGGRLVKAYRARVARVPDWPFHVCERPIAHHPRKRDRMVVQRGERTPHRGRWYPAATWFRRADRDLVDISIHTGVMHQIRVHAAFLGIPLRGDRLYGGGEPEGPGFYLHHSGFAGEGDPDVEVVTQPVVPPDWAR